MPVLTLSGLYAFIFQAIRVAFTRAPNATMKRRIVRYLLMFSSYCLIFMLFNGWELTNRELAEMIFMGTLTALFDALMYHRMTRFVEKMVKQVLTK